jgi:hypothetical protein
MIHHTKHEANVTKELPVVTILVDDEATVAHAKMEVFGYVYEATGSAKKHPKDYYNRDIGIAIATSRALISLGQALINDASEQSDLIDARRYYSKHAPF